jgi:hypothetical protein
MVWIWECCWEGEGEGEKEEEEVDAGESAFKLFILLLCSKSPDWLEECDCCCSMDSVLELVCALEEDDKEDSESAGEASAEAVIVICCMVAILNYEEEEEAVQCGNGVSLVIYLFSFVWTKKRKETKA